MTDRNTVCYRLSDQSRLKLERIAWELGLTWGGRGSVGQLLEAIAQGKVKVKKS